MKKRQERELETAFLTCNFTIHSFFLLSSPSLGHWSLQKPGRCEHWLFRGARLALHEKRRARILQHAAATIGPYTYSIILPSLPVDFAPTHGTTTATAAAFTLPLLSRAFGWLKHGDIRHIDGVCQAFPHLPLTFLSLATVGGLLLLVILQYGLALPDALQQLLTFPSLILRSVILLCLMCVCVFCYVHVCPLLTLLW